MAIELMEYEWQVDLRATPTFKMNGESPTYQWDVDVPKR